MPVHTDKTLDIRGLVSPRAETVIRDTLAGMQSGQILTVVTTCRTLKCGINALCDRLGCTVLEIKEASDNFSIRIKRGGMAVPSSC